MCVSPLIRYRYKYLYKKDDNLIIPIGEGNQFQIKSQKQIEPLFPNFGSFLSYLDTYCDYQFIPCRKCVECKEDYSKQWAIRCYHESVTSVASCFITLTIDDLHANALNDSLAEQYERKGKNTYCSRCIKGNRYYRYPINYTLNKHFLLDWLKKFRDTLYRDKGIKIRYFGCGEYGSENERPHYHLIIFGYDFPDKMNYSLSQSGYPIYFSDELSNLWPYGYATVQDCCFETCFYTAKYCTKKINFFNDEAAHEYYYGRQMEFLVMSKGNCQVNRCDYIDDLISYSRCNDSLSSLRNLTNPFCRNCDKTRGGLGYEWLRRNYNEVIKLGYVVINGVKYPIPDYYKELIKLTSKNDYDILHLKSLEMYDEILNERPLERSLERLKVKECVKKSKIHFYTGNSSI